MSDVLGSVAVAARPHALQTSCAPPACTKVGGSGGALGCLRVGCVPRPVGHPHPLTTANCNLPLLPAADLERVSVLVCKEDETIKQATYSQHSWEERRDCEAGQCVFEDGHPVAYAGEWLFCKWAARSVVFCGGGVMVRRV